MAASILSFNLQAVPWVVGVGPGGRATNTALVQHALGVSNSGCPSIRLNPIVDEGPAVVATVPVTDGVGLILSGTGFYLSVSFCCWVWCGTLTFVHGCLLVSVCTRVGMVAAPGAGARPVAVDVIVKMVVSVGSNSCLAGT